VAALLWDFAQPWALLLLATEDWMVVATLEAVVFKGAAVAMSPVMELPAENLWEI